jgi:Integrase core domain
MGIRDKPIAPGSPWQNPHVERLIGTIRRECLDHVIVFGEAHLRRILSRYAAYYNVSRIHRSLDKDSPFHRAIERLGLITSQPVLGGLHHNIAESSFRHTQVIAASSSSHPFAEHRRAVELVAFLRHRADDLVTERLHETAQLLYTRGVRDVADARDLNADEDRARHGRFSFHDRGGSTNRAGRDGDGATPGQNVRPRPPIRPPSQGKGGRPS